MYRTGQARHVSNQGTHVVVGNGVYWYTYFPDESVDMARTDLKEG